MLSKPVFFVPAFTIEFAMRLLLVVALVLLLLPVLSFWARSRPTLGVRLKFGWAWVYVFQDIGNPRLFKIGMTKRTCRTRMREVSIDMTGGSRLRQVYGVHVPFGATVEQVAHRRAARFHYPCERGTEWFSLRSPKDIGLIIEAVEKSAHDVRKMAKRRRLWSPEADKTATFWKLGANGAVRERLFPG